MRTPSPEPGGQNSYCNITTPSCITLSLPLPPSINEQYATVNGHRVTTAPARRFKQHVRSLLRTLSTHDELLARFRQSYLALSLDFYFTTPLKRDLDGGLKITQD